MRKENFHPASTNEVDTKNWLHIWGMWEQVEAMTLSLLCGAIDECLQSVPQDRLKDYDGDAEKFRDAILGYFNQ